MRATFWSLACFLLASTTASTETSTKVCPVLGPAFPYPTGLSSNKQFQESIKDFDAAVTTALQTDTTPFGASYFNITSMSIGMFSPSEDGLIYQRHYTSPSVRNSSIGTQNVDADSVYRLGSIGKLLTVYLFLVREGDIRFKDPITMYIPELARAAASITSPNGITPNWTEITVGQLASHMSGMFMDFGLSEIGEPAVIPPRFPPLPEDQVPPCNYIWPNQSYVTCTAEQYLAGIIAAPAIFQSGQTPSYSNNAFVLLGTALSNIIGSDLETIFNESFVDALGLTGTSFTNPTSNQNAVIPGGDPTTTGWDAIFGVFTAVGGYFSSTSDMAKIGKSILNSTLMPKQVTRRWMKPVTFTSSVNVGIGAPWEIWRTQINNRTVDLYAKNGGWGGYSTELILVPDFDFGFSILTASTLSAEVTFAQVYLLSDMVASTVLPALETAARDQAKANFAGQYVAKDSNSSLAITVDDQPGLRIIQWTTNGTEVFDDLGLNDTGTYIDFRLQPNFLYTGKEVGFTGTWKKMPALVWSGALDVNCLTWGEVGDITYGNVGVGEFVFEIDPTTGKAVSVQPKALRMTLERKE